MTQQTYRANLSLTKLPLRPDKQGRTIISSTIDQNFVWGTGSPELSANNARGVPTFQYGYNVMPTEYGIQSIGYYPIIAAPVGETAINKIIQIRDATLGILYCAINLATGKTYLTTYSTSTPYIVWTLINTFPINQLDIIPVYINGKTYIYLPTQTQFYVFDAATKTFLVQILTGLNLSTIITFTAASGYLIAFGSNNVVAWSSTLDPTDFTPSLITGAGGGSIQEIRSKITGAQSVQNGFLIFAETNIIAASYSGNSRYPFIFRALEGSGGLQGVNVVPPVDNPATDLFSSVSEQNHIYAFTTSGIQRLQLAKAETIYPDITDFLVGSSFEDFDLTNLWTKATKSFGTIQTQRKITLIASRYLIISYVRDGSFVVNGFTDAVVIDLQLERYGCLRLFHSDCFDYIPAANASPSLTLDVGRSVIGFITLSGAVYTVDFTDAATIPLSFSFKSLLVLSKYQVDRNHLMELHGVEIENVYNKTNFNLYDCPSLDGASLQPAISAKLVTIGAAGYKGIFRNTGINHTLIMTGSFNLSSLLLTFVVDARR